MLFYFSLLTFLRTAKGCPQSALFQRGICNKTATTWRSNCPFGRCCLPALMLSTQLQFALTLMTNSLFNYNNRWKWITDCGTFGTAFTFPCRSFPLHTTFSILFNFFQAKIKDEKGQACLSALDNSGHRLDTKPSLSICSTSPCWQRWTILDNVHGIEKKQTNTHFLGHFLEDNRSRHHFKQRECLNNNDEEEEEEEWT